MAKRKSAPKRRYSKAHWTSFGRKYARTLNAIRSNELTHLKLADQLHRMALSADDVETEVHEHILDGRKKKPISRHLKLADPESSLLSMNRFCNIWVPLPIFVCMMAGCPPVITPPGRVCFLINCQMDVCPLGNGQIIKLRCTYLCIRIVG
jgi:hypothetical protein